MRADRRRQIEEHRCEEAGELLGALRDSHSLLGRERDERVVERLRCARERPRERARALLGERLHALYPAAGELAARAEARGLRRIAARRRRLGRQLVGAAFAAAHFVEPAHEALAARAVEQHVKPREREIGAGAAAVVANRVAAQKLAMLAVVASVQARKQHGRQRSGVAG